MLRRFERPKSSSAGEKGEFRGLKSLLSIATLTAVDPNEIIHFITKRRDRGRATERSNGLLKKPEDGATEQADDIE